MQRLMRNCVLIYIVIYGVEAVVRWLLNMASFDNGIFLRDALLVVPMILLFGRQALAGRVHPAFWVIFGLIALHGMVFYLNFRQIAPVLYGAKIMASILFGLIVGEMLLVPDRLMFRVFLAVWLIVAIGAVLDKAGVNFPWLNMTATVGGVKVELSRNWEITDAAARRVGGFTRSSINVAEMLPTLALVLYFGIRRISLKILLILCTLGAVFLTTQRGGLIGYALTTLVLLLPGQARLSGLRIMCLVVLVLDCAVPLLTEGMHFPVSDGVVNTASFVMRMEITWPQAFDWIRDNNLFPFGVGLGGISGPQRLYAPDSVNPADNIFVFLFAFFGFLAFFYMAWIGYLALKSRDLPKDLAEPALAVLLFQLSNGLVLSMIEDQIASLFLGAAIGALWFRASRRPLPAPPGPVLPAWQSGAWEPGQQVAIRR
jgi:hypothetical protein